jgi:hypothetical protein
MEEKEKYAVLSKAAYDFKNNGLDIAQKELQSYSQTKNHKIDIKLSGPNAVVLTEGEGGAPPVIISYRGTDITNPSDIFADAQILLGRDKIKIFLNDRFDEANQLFTKVKKEYPNSDIMLTGHSLGSAEAIYVGTRNNTKSISFNEGTSPLDVVFSQFGNKEANDKQIVFITGQDVLSNLSILQPYDVRVVPAPFKKTGTKNAREGRYPSFISHSINYFLPEKETPTREVVSTVLKTTPAPKRYKPRKRVTIQQEDYGIDYFKDLVKQRAKQLQLRFD